MQYDSPFNKDDPVNQYTPVGKVGNTGTGSKGAHLHYGVFKNPVGESGSNEDNDNRNGSIYPILMHENTTFSYYSEHDTARINLDYNSDGSTPFSLNLEESNTDIGNYNFKESNTILNEFIHYVGSEKFHKWVKEYKPGENCFYDFLEYFDISLNLCSQIINENQLTEFYDIEKVVSEYAQYKNEKYN